MKKRPSPAAPELPPEVRPGQSIELLKQLHILTREGKLNQDSRRKLKQVYHLFQFIEKLLLELPESPQGPTLADHGAGKSYLGFIIYDLFFKALGQGTIYGIETRSELVESSKALAQRLGFGSTSAADARPFHLVCIVFHAINTVFVYLLLGRLEASRRSPVRSSGTIRSRSTSPPEADFGGNRTDLTPWYAAFGAALFAVHPLQVESVAWVSGIPGVLGAALALGSGSVPSGRSSVSAPGPRRAVHLVFTVAGSVSPKSSNDTASRAGSGSKR